MSQPRTLFEKIWDRHVIAERGADVDYNDPFIPEFPTTFGFGFPVLSTNPGAFRDGVIATMQALAGTGNWDFDTLSFQVVPETPTTGTLEVASDPSSATVRLDGATIGATDGMTI